MHTFSFKVTMQPSNICLVAYSPTGYDTEYVFNSGVGQQTVTYTEPGDYEFKCTVNDTMGNTEVGTTASQVKERMINSYNKAFLLTKSS